MLVDLGEEGAHGLVRDSAIEVALAHHSFFELEQPTLDGATLRLGQIFVTEAKIMQQVIELYDPLGVGSPGGSRFPAVARPICSCDLFPGWRRGPCSYGPRGSRILAGRSFCRSGPTCSGGGSLSGPGRAGRRGSRRRWQLGGDRGQERARPTRVMGMLRAEPGQWSHADLPRRVQRAS